MTAAERAELRRLLDAGDADHAKPGGISQPSPVYTTWAHLNWPRVAALARKALEAAGR